ncbi:hypothetical protein MES4922_30511 [Mesorhizobium ventifaucium]|uniref:Transposase n=1 Tax=Mesorhizobium ventifaucium TaxID=666020 RepID=A0ABM9DZB3_9HYPH|nr:hypothetical protein MES4922_30511 [Mesorhizobium ventifaucium]
MCDAGDATLPTAVPLREHGTAVGPKARNQKPHLSSIIYLMRLSDGWKPQREPTKDSLIFASIGLE